MPPTASSRRAHSLATVRKTAQDGSGEAQSRGPVDSHATTVPSYIDLTLSTVWLFENIAFSKDDSSLTSGHRRCEKWPVFNPPVRGRPRCDHRSLYTDVEIYPFCVHPYHPHPPRARGDRGAAVERHPLSWERSCLAAEKRIPLDHSRLNFQRLLLSPRAADIVQIFRNAGGTLPTIFPTVRSPLDQNPWEGGPDPRGWV